MSNEDEIDTDEIEEKFIKMEVTEIYEPEDAHNDRGNPDVEVTVHLSGMVLEQYCFEFVHPRHSEKCQKYGYGLHRATQGAKESENRNEAMFKAAQALADHTDTPVELIAYPTKDLVDERKSPDE